MAKKSLYLFLAAILLLVAIDQVAKLYIDNCFEIQEGILQVKTPHIHPILNDESVINAVQQTETTNMPYWLIILCQIAKYIFVCAVAMLPLIISAKAGKAAGIQVSKFLKNAGLCLISAVCAIRIIGIIFWGGTLDFICFPKPTTTKALHCADCGHIIEVPAILHRSFDFGDIYMMIGMILVLSLTVYYLARFAFAYANAEAEKRTEIRRNIKRIFIKDTSK